MLTNLPRCWHARRAALLAGACAAALPIAVRAQDVPPLPQAGDPPARVGRLATLQGMVSFRAQDGASWIPATLNYPITSGNAVQVAQPGRAEIQVDADRFALPGATELDIARLDDSAFAATLAQGEACFTLGSVPPGRTYSVQTPRGLVQIVTSGRYAVTAGDTEHPTLVIVLAGAAQVTAPGLNLQVAPGQAASLTGPGQHQAQGAVGPAPPDQCLTDLIAEEQPRRSAGPPPPPEVLQMTGGDSLAGYGAWQPEADYGNVWFPPVEAGWVPYRHGHWAFVAPWGWTWCDDAPWGFAPFHYGRWARFGDRWGWTPGSVAHGGPPVYAPALVTFFGLGGVGVAIGAGVLAGSVGWVPLAPREPYYPWYHVSPNYVREINVRHVTNITNVVNNYTNNTYTTVVVNHYGNATAATAMPAAAMARSQAVAGLAQPVAPQQLAAARPLVGRLAEPGAPAAAAGAAAFRLPTPEHAGALARPLIAPRAAAVPALQARPGGAAGPASPPLPAARGEAHPLPAARPAEPQARPELRPPAAAPQAPRGEARPVPAPSARPVEPTARPEARPVPAPAVRPVEPTARPEARPVPAPAVRPMEPTARPEARPMPAPAARPVEPTVRPEPRPPVEPRREATPRPAEIRPPAEVARPPEHREAPRPAPAQRPGEEKRKLPDQP